MQRRNFLFAGLFAFPSLALTKTKLLFQTRKGFKVAAGTDRNNGAIKFGGAEPNNLKVSGADNAGGLCIFEGDSARKGGPPLHIHADQDETFYIVKGKFRFQVGDETFEVSDGDCVFAPRGVPHTFALLTQEPSKMITIFQPAGKMESFFEAWGKYVGRRDPEVVKKIFADHGMQIVGPPLAIND